MCSQVRRILSGELSMAATSGWMMDSTALSPSRFFLRVFLKIRRPGQQRWRVDLQTSVL
jgi:hypothetical protein